MVELGVLIVQSVAFGSCPVPRRVIAFPLFALPACWSTFVELTVFGGCGMFVVGFCWCCSVDFLVMFFAVRLCLILFPSRRLFQRRVAR